MAAHTLDNRGVQVQEDMLEFELDNMPFKVQRSRLAADAKWVKLPNDPEAPFESSSCTTLPPNYFLDEQLQPVWYKQQPNAINYDDYWEDGSGNKIVRYNVPGELLLLTVFEQLLICNIAPYIPSICLNNRCLL